MHHLDENGEEGQCPRVNGHKIAILGMGHCGINLIYHLDQVLGTREDVEVMGFTRMALDFLQMSHAKTFCWGDRVVEGSELTTPEKFDLIDEHLAELEKHISGSDVLIIVSGLGGLTGSHGSVRLVQRVDRSRTKIIAFVVTPFSGERKYLKYDPEMALADLDRTCDLIVHAPNDGLVEIAPKDTVSAGFARTRSLFEQLVRKVLDAGSENGDLFLDDPDGLAKIHINGVLRWDWKERPCECHRL